MRDSQATGCPPSALAREAARHGDVVSASFTDGFLRMAAAVEAMLDPALPAVERRRLSRAVIAAQIGTITVARPIGRTDMGLSDEVLTSVRSLLEPAPPTSRAKRGRGRCGARARRG